MQRLVIDSTWVGISLAHNIIGVLGLVRLQNVEWQLFEIRWRDPAVSIS